MGPGVKVRLDADKFVVTLERVPFEGDLDPSRELEYRADGWPLCPRCGEDELASVLALRGKIDRKTLEIYTAKPTDEMVCYHCRWSGAVASRQETLRRRARLEGA